MKTTIYLIALMFSISCASGKVLFTKDVDVTDVEKETELPKNPTQNELKSISEEVLSELRSLDSSDASPRSFGFLKHKIAALESKLSYLFSKFWPFSPVYIDVNQDPYPYSQTYYRKQDSYVNNNKPSIFSNIFKSPEYAGDYYNYNYNGGHGISKRSVQEEGSPSTLNETNGVSEGRTLHHIFPAFQNRFNYFMNRIFSPAFQPYPQPNRNYAENPPRDHYKKKLENSLEYGNDFDQGTSSQFHYQSANSPNEIIPNFLQRLGLVPKNDFVSEYLTRVLRRVQTPVVKQKHAESFY